MSANSWHCCASCSKLLIRSAARCDESTTARRNCANQSIGAGSIFPHRRVEHRVDRWEHRLPARRQPRASSARASSRASKSRSSLRRVLAARHLLRRRREAPPRRRCDSRSSRWSVHARSKALAHQRSSSSPPAAAVISAARPTSRCSNATDGAQRGRSIRPGPRPSRSILRSTSAAPADAASLVRPVQPAGHVQQHAHRVAQAAEERGGQHAWSRSVPASRRASTSRCAGQVAAVHRRDVQRRAAA